MLKNTRLYAESWNVAWRKKGTGSILSDKETEFHIIPNSFRYWAADPFIFNYKGTVYVFAELYDYICMRGCIGYCTINNGSVTSWKKIIQEKYHLSFPNVFENDGEIYILPEASASGKLYMYKATEFPDKWEKCENIAQGVKLVDSVRMMPYSSGKILTYDISSDKYVLKILDVKGDDSYLVDDNEYFLQRPAGKFFIYKDNCFRPAQICEKDYGEGLIFYKTMSENKYTEERIQTLRPEQLQYDREIVLTGMHTYNSNDSFEVIDLKTRRFSLLNLVFRIWGKVN